LNGITSLPNLTKIYQRLKSQWGWEADTQDGDLIRLSPFLESRLVFSFLESRLKAVLNLCLFIYYRSGQLDQLQEPHIKGQQSARQYVTQDLVLKKELLATIALKDTRLTNYFSNNYKHYLDLY
jgi:hypothetical protein